MSLDNGDGSLFCYHHIHVPILNVDPNRQSQKARRIVNRLIKEKVRDLTCFWYHEIITLTAQNVDVKVKSTKLFVTYAYDMAKNTSRFLQEISLKLKEVGCDKASKMLDHIIVVKRLVKAPIKKDN